MELYVSFYSPVLFFKVLLKQGDSNEGKRENDK